MIANLYASTDVAKLHARALELDEDPATMPLAERLYLECLRIDPQYAPAIADLGAIAYRRGDTPRARTLWLAALRAEPGMAEPLYNIGYSYLDEGLTCLAARWLLRSVASDPSFADAHYNLAHALMLLGDMLGAVRHWKRYLALDPRGPWAERARERLREAVRACNGEKR